MHPHSLRLLAIFLLILALGFLGLFIFSLIIGAWYWAIGFFVANLVVSLLTRYLKKKKFPHSPDFPKKRG